MEPTAVDPSGPEVVTESVFSAVPASDAASEVESTLSHRSILCQRRSVHIPAVVSETMNVREVIAIRACGGECLQVSVALRAGRPCGCRCKRL